MDRNFLPWFAGFWEGEGSLSLYKCPDRSKRPFYHLTLTVSQAGDTGREVMEYIRNQWGFGHIYRQNPSKMSYRCKPLWLWAVQSTLGVKKVLTQISPFLVFKKEKVKKVLEEIAELEPQLTRCKWTEEEVNFLKKNYKNLTWREISVTLKRHSFWAVARKAQYLGLSRKEFAGVHPGKSYDRIIDLSRLQETSRAHRVKANGPTKKFQGLTLPKIPKAELERRKER